MTNRASNPAAVDLLQHEFAQERASALGRLGRAFEAALPYGISSFSAKHAGCGICAMCCVNTGCLWRSPVGWAS